MSALYNALALTFCVVYVVDISGAMNTLNRQIFRLIYGSKIAYNGWQIPLISCSKCLTFWAVLASTVIENHEFMNSILVASIASFLSQPTADTLKLAIELWHKTLDRWTERD